MNIFTIISQDVISCFILSRIKNKDMISCFKSCKYLYECSKNKLLWIKRLKIFFNDEINYETCDDAKYYYIKCSTAECYISSYNFYINPIKFVKNQSEMIQLDSVNYFDNYDVKKHPINFIENPTKNVIKKSITHHYKIVKILNTKNIKLSKKLKKKAVKADYRSLEYIKDIDNELLLYAGKHDKRSYHYISNHYELTEEMFNDYVNAYPKVLNKLYQKIEKYPNYYEFIIKLLKKNSHNIQYIDNPSNKLIKLSISIDGNNIQYIK